MKKKSKPKAHSSKRRKASHGKQSLIDDVMVKGISSTKAAQTVDAVIKLWKDALSCQEVVEIPGGTIQSRIRQGKERRKWQKFRNVTGKVFYKIVNYPGWRRVVKFTPDKKLDMTPPPKPDTPETPDDLQARQIASELLRRPADKGAMAKLQYAVKAHPQNPWEVLLANPKPGALLRRLKDIKARGWQNFGVDSLAQQVTSLHWVR